MNPSGASSQYSQLKGLLAKGLPASLKALEKMAPRSDSLSEMASHPDQDTKLKVGLLWAAARAPVQLDTRLEAWTWLESKGLSVPLAWAPHLLPPILDQQDLGLLTWLEERWGHMDAHLWDTNPSSTWAHALRRVDTSALHRLSQVAPPPAYVPDQKELSLPSLAVTWHKDAALPSLLWLRDHGVALCPTPEQSPLLRIARQFRDRAGGNGGVPDPDRVIVLQKKYMAMWDMLVEAGVDPHVPSSQGPSAYDLMMLTPAQGVLIARQRATCAPSGPTLLRALPPRQRA